MIAIVTGMIATYPLGGVVWDYGQYALGLERLGFDVYYLEDTGSMTYDPLQACYVEDPAYAVAYLRSSLAGLSPKLGRQWLFRAMDGSVHGMADADFDDVLGAADLFLNVSGGTLLRDRYMRCRRKVLIDTDPGWNHFRNYPRIDADPQWAGGSGYRAHDFFFTYAERIGHAGCRLPMLGIDWMPTRPPVLLDAWSAEPPGSVWTTVMTWKNFNEVIEADGVCYGTKEVEFERIVKLPRRISTAQFELAVGGLDHPGAVSDPHSGAPMKPIWQANGWSAIDSLGVSRSADDYRHYVQRSRGEFSVAKNVYVATRSGWSSCRSVCYLASGRPVVLQDTGFSDVIPCGEGLLTFSTMDEAVAAVQSVESDTGRHREAARDMASRHFAADIVLGEILHRIGAG